MSDGWQSVASLPSLEAGEVQVWRIDLAEIAESDEVHDLCKRHLSQDELARAERFRASQVRMQFLAGRACLRILLGNILGVPPKEVPITLNAYGKPETPPRDDKPLYFNLAHSRETVLIALCRESRVGIDLEYLDRETDILGVARASFTESERRQIEEFADAAQRQRAFFQCWTRKEAVIKADGRGLSLPLSAFEVPVREAARFTAVHVGKEAGASGGPSTWFVSDLSVGEAVMAAIAVEVTPPRLTKCLFPLAEVRHAALKA